MPAPREILDLVARFEQQLEADRSGQYNETQGVPSPVLQTFICTEGPYSHWRASTAISLSIRHGR